MLHPFIPSLTIIIRCIPIKMLLSSLVRPFNKFDALSKQAESRNLPANALLSTIAMDHDFLSFPAKSL
jgi:hypothetical protein